MEPDEWQAARHWWAAAQWVALAAVCVARPPWITGLARLSLLYVAVAWIAVGLPLLGWYASSSMARFSQILRAAMRTAAGAMWLVPGVLLLASPKGVLVALGVAVVMFSARTVALGRVPQGEAIPRRKRRHRRAQVPVEVGSMVQRQSHFARETGPSMLAALALQAGLYALAGRYPLMSALSIAAATALWTRLSVKQGAAEPRETGTGHAVGVILVTVLLTGSLTAVLVEDEIPRDRYRGVVEGFLNLPVSADTTPRVLARMLKVPNEPGPAAQAEGEPERETVATQVVDPTPAKAKGMGEGIPGLVLRPREKRSQRVRVIEPGATLRLLPGAPLEIPFTGEYRLFRGSSGGLPTGAQVERGTPLDAAYRTTDTSPMQTVAVQTFDPPLDLSHCDRVMVRVLGAEKLPLLATMELVGAGGTEDGGTDVMGTKPGEETLEFHMQRTAKPLLVDTMRITFERPVLERYKSARGAVLGFVMIPRGR